MRFRERFARCYLQRTMLNYGIKTDKELYEFPYSSHRYKPHDGTHERDEREVLVPVIIDVTAH